ncbi:MAG: arginine decarboxylase, partial [Thiothrix sp.]|nr:arginine decarboxylase [Thiothrix sp.]
MHKNLEWSTTSAQQLYNVQHWSNGYFGINDQGHVTMQLPSQPERQVDLYELAQRIQLENDIRLPVLVRFTDILKHRVKSLQQAFTHAIEDAGQDSRYTAIFPIKVNQQRTVVQQILAGGGSQVGLEAGSKPELMAVLGLAPEGSTIICNGYKDREYLRLALIGRQMGHAIYIVI